MNIGRKLRACLGLGLIPSIIWLLSTPVIPPAHAQNSYQATLAIRLDQPRWTINRSLYGQFAEHLGRLIYEGIWVGENSPQLTEVLMSQAGKQMEA